MFTQRCYHGNRRITTWKQCPKEIFQTLHWILTFQNIHKKYLTGKRAIPSQVHFTKRAPSLADDNIPVVVLFITEVHITNVGRSAIKCRMWDSRYMNPSCCDLLKEKGVENVNIVRTTRQKLLLHVFPDWLAVGSDWPACFPNLLVIFPAPQSSPYTPQVNQEL